MSLETVHKRPCGSFKSTNSCKLSDLNLLAEGSSKVAVDGFEPAILRWQAGIASTRPQARVSELRAVTRARRARHLLRAHKFEADGEKRK